MVDTLEKSKRNIVVYVASGCIYCHNLEKYFREHNIIFDKVDVTKNNNTAEDVIKKMGRLAVPVVKINNEIVIGFDKERLRNLLNIKK